MERNIRLVVLISGKYLSYGISRDDIIQEGMVGLQKAVCLFNPDMGCRFSTYASWWIKAVMARYCRNHGRIVRLPLGVQERFEKIYAAMERLESNGEEIDVLSISKMTGLSLSVLRKMNFITFERHRSIDAASESGAKLADGLSDPNDRLQDVDISIDVQVIEKIANELPDRLNYILRARAGLDEGEGKTLQEIADQLNISRERVRQLESDAHDMVRHELKRGVSRKNATTMV